MKVMDENVSCAHDLPVCSADGFSALSPSALHDVWARPGNFFALVRELLSLAQRK
jgi:hypothetical protein